MNECFYHINRQHTHIIWCIRCVLRTGFIQKVYCFIHWVISWRVWITYKQFFFYLFIQYNNKNNTLTRIANSRVVELRETWNWKCNKHLVNVSLLKFSFFLFCYWKWLLVAILCINVYRYTIILIYSSIFAIVFFLFILFICLFTCGIHFIFISLKCIWFI